MVNYFIYARDYSFSTFNNEHYHSNGLKTLEQFKRDVANIKEEQSIENSPSKESRIIYLHWGDDCWEVDEEETRNAYLNLHCEPMGTNPIRIIQYLQKYVINETDTIKLLYIITDGSIDDVSVKKCFRLNDFMNYEMFVFHAFNKDPEKIDLSVAASFFKSRCMVYRNYKLYASSDISKEFEYDKINAYNFADKKDQLKSYITLKFINEFKQSAVVLDEIDKLKKLRNRLFDALTNTVNVDKIDLDFEIKDKSLFRNFVENDWNYNFIFAFNVIKKDIEKSISVLINTIISDAKSYLFDALKFDTEFDKSIADKQVKNSDSIFEMDDIFEFDLEEDEYIEMSCGNRIILDAI